MRSYALVLATGEFYKDALVLAQALQEGRLFAPKNIHVLTPLNEFSTAMQPMYRGEPTMSNIWQSWNEIYKSIDKHSSFLFYFSGHAANFKMEVGPLNQEEFECKVLQSQLRGCVAQRKLVIWDCCYSEQMAESMKSKPGSNLADEDLLRDTIQATVADDSSGTIYWAGAKYKHAEGATNGRDVSTFTYHLIAALKGAEYCPARALKKKKGKFITRRGTSSASPSLPISQPAQVDSLMPDRRPSAKRGLHFSPQSVSPASDSHVTPIKIGPAFDSSPCRSSTHSSPMSIAASPLAGSARRTQSMVYLCAAGSSPASSSTMSPATSPASPAASARSLASPSVSDASPAMDFSKVKFARSRSAGEKKCGHCYDFRKITTIRKGDNHQDGYH